MVDETSPKGFGTADNKSLSSQTTTDNINEHRNSAMTETHADSLPSGAAAPAGHQVPVETSDEKPPNQPQQPQQAQSEDLYKPKTLKFWLVVLSTFTSMFLVALDRTILATAIPRITDDFKSLGDIGWYGSAYMLTTAAFQLLFGRIYTFYDLKWTFLVSIFIFEVGSAICGAAPSSPVFIFGRAVAGVGSAGIMTGSMMTIIPLVPLHKRPMFQCKSPHILPMCNKQSKLTALQQCLASFSASPLSPDPSSAALSPSRQPGDGVFT